MCWRFRSVQGETASSRASPGRRNLPHCNCFNHRMRFQFSFCFYSEPSPFGLCYVSFTLCDGPCECQRCASLSEPRTSFPPPHFHLHHQSTDKKSVSAVATVLSAASHFLPALERIQQVYFFFPTPTNTPSEARDFAYRVPPTPPSVFRNWRGLEAQYGVPRAGATMVLGEKCRDGVALIIIGRDCCACTSRSVGLRSGLSVETFATHTTHTFLTLLSASSDYHSQRWIPPWATM